MCEVFLHVHPMYTFCAKSVRTLILVKLTIKSTSLNLAPKSP